MQSKSTFLESVVTAHCLCVIENGRANWGLTTHALQCLPWYDNNSFAITGWFI